MSNHGVVTRISEGSEGGLDVALLVFEIRELTNARKTTIYTRRASVQIYFTEDI